jgi:hypothetical protein
MLEIVVAYDCTGADLGKFPMPRGVGLVGYVTGSQGVPWTAAQFAQHPDAVRIDQSPINTPADELADEADYEAGAVTLADLPAWYRAALANYNKAARPGQRAPAVYASASNITPVCNAFVAAGITSGPRLHVAHWDLPVEQAIDTLTYSGGPFPVIGIQIHNAGLYDVNLYLASWWSTVSHVPPPAPRHGIVVTDSATAGDALDVVNVTSTDGGHTWR